MQLRWNHLLISFTPEKSASMMKMFLICWLQHLDAAKQSINTGNTTFAKLVAVYFKTRGWQCSGGPAGYVIEDDVLSDVY